MKKNKLADLHFFGEKKNTYFQYPAVFCGCISCHDVSVWKYISSGFFCDFGQVFLSMLFSPNFLKYYKAWRKKEKKILLSAFLCIITTPELQCLFIAIIYQSSVLELTRVSYIPDLNYVFLVVRMSSSTVTKKVYFHEL